MICCALSVPRQVWNPACVVDCALLELDAEISEPERSSLLEVGELSLEELVSAELFAMGELGLESLHAVNANDATMIAGSENTPLFKRIFPPYFFPFVIWKYM